mgnify:CR=1 FL=1
MLIDWLSAVQLKLIMKLDIPDFPPKCPTLGMAVIGGADVVLMIDQTKIPVGKLHMGKATYYRHAIFWVVYIKQRWNAQFFSIPSSLIIEES